MATLRCPKCGASEADGDGFSLIWNTRVTYSGSAATVEGALVYPEDWSEIAFQRNRQAILRCDECGHAWVTSREIEGT